MGTFNILDSTFGADGRGMEDAGIISALLRTIHKHVTMDIVDMDGDSRLTTKLPLRVCIEDFSHGEESPHFRLDVGEIGDWSNGEPDAVLEVPYFDAHSIVDKRTHVGLRVDLTPGHYCIRVWYPRNLNAAKMLAVYLDERYCEEMAKRFPDYAVLTGATRGKS